MCSPRRLPVETEGPPSKVRQRPEPTGHPAEPAAAAPSLNPGDPGLTCCQNATLTNPTSEFHSRIDLVLTHGAARAVEAHVVGNTLFQATPPLWPSDHAGVVATVRIH